MKAFVLLAMFPEFPTTVDELHAVFDVIDVANSGKINYKQFTDALCYKRQAQVFLFPHSEKCPSYSRINVYRFLCQ
jgi:hypothetical protein